MLERQEAAGAPEPGLDLVQTNSAPAPRQSSWASPQVAVAAAGCDALALDRLDEERRHVAGRELALAARRGRRSGTGSQPGSSGPKRSRNSSLPLTDSAPEREPVEGVVAVEDPRAAGGGARELDRRLDRLGAAVGRAPPPRGAPGARASSCSASTPRQQRDAELGEGWRSRRPGTLSSCGHAPPGGCGPARRRRSRRAGRGSARRGRRSGARPRRAPRCGRSRASRSDPRRAAG